MNEVIQVRLREAGKISYFLTGSLKFNVGEYIIVEQSRGLEYGQIVSEPETVLDTEIERPLRKIIRKTNPSFLYRKRYIWFFEENSLRTI